MIKQLILSVSYLEKTNIKKETEPVIFQMYVNFNFQFSFIPQTDSKTHKISTNRLK